ncbi:MAG: response regulator transcription factor [Rhodospirillales bacterium]|nr:response regulator transcription factor [Rhodospirillales bacterium]MCW8971634.1 response regulator transcription factor [Rhodospirillales bacterium]
MEVLIADDHSIVRSGLRHMVEELGDDVTVTEANTFWQTLAHCKATVPDMIIIDLNMPGLEDHDVLQPLVRLVEPTPVVIFSMEERPEIMRAILARGVRAYIPKSTDQTLITPILRLIAAGGSYIPRILAMPPPATTASDDTEWNLASEAIEALTRRQREVLDLLAQGLPNMDIGKRMDLNLSTVKTHVTGVLKALGVENRTQAVLAYRHFLQRNG